MAGGSVTAAASGVRVVVVVGGGAAGLTAAIAAAREGAGVTVAERLERVGKKLLATGNGRCNLSNESINTENYLSAESAESGGVRAAMRLIGARPPGFVTDFFSSVGVLTACEDGRIYPRSFSASTALDALRREADRMGVETLSGRAVASVVPAESLVAAAEPRRRLAVLFEDGGALFADSVVVAAGGSAAPAFGTDGSAYKILTAHGHKLLRPVPALTRIRVGRESIRGLKGVRVRCRASLRAAVHAYGAGHFEKSACDRVIRAEAGEVIFADGGLSGIPILNLSLFLAGADCARPGSIPASAPVCRTGALASRENRAAAVGKRVGSYGGYGGFYLSLDLLPERDADWLAGFVAREFEKALGKSNDDDEIRANALSGFLNKRVAALVLREAIRECHGRAEPAQIARAVKDWRLPVVGVDGFDAAQTTFGGISLADFNPDTLESKRLAGLYAAGEILDVAGLCGGYNLHWAWVSGYVAGRGAGRGLSPIGRL